MKGILHMKRIIKKIVCTVAAAVMMMTCGTTAFAAVKISNANDARNSVVFIFGTGYAPAVNEKGEYLIDENGQYIPKKNGWSGTGFAVGDPDKPVEFIITNAHVVLDDYGLQCDLKVYFSYAQNDFVIPTIYKIDEQKDIAVLKLPEPTDKRTALVLCPSDAVDMNAEVTALGFPGVSDKLTDNAKYDINDVTVTRGIISRKIYQNETMRSMYQIDAYINHGNSGGPLVNGKGEVIGINSEGLEGEANVNAAICIDELINLVTRDQIGYVLSTDKPDFNPVPIIIIAVVVLAASAAVVLRLKKKAPAAEAVPAKKVSAAVPGSAPAQSSGNSNGSVIVCEKGVLAGRTFTVGSGVIIGRNTEKCSVCLPIDTKGISGVHCEIRKTAKGFEIIDRGSSYGTFLGNGQKLTPNVPVYIPDGTYFTLGSAEQLFQIRY